MGGAGGGCEARKESGVRGRGGDVYKWKVSGGQVGCSRG